MPPYKKLTFNSSLKNNDGLLANHIATEENLSYNEALSHVDAYVKQIRQELSSDAEYTMQNIGRFIVGKENKIQFEQDLKVNYLPKAFGMSAFAAIPVHRESIDRKVERKLKEQIPTVKKVIEENKVLRKKSRKPIVITTMVMLLAALLFFSSQNRYILDMAHAGFNLVTSTPEPRYHESNTVDLPDNDEEKTSLKSLLAMNPDTAHYLNIVIGGSVPIVVRLREEVKTTQQTPAGSASMPFHIVGGAFAVPENAMKLKNKLARSGYPSMIVTKRGSPLKCVSYGGFPTREEALRALDRIRAIQQDVWIMTL